MTVYVDTARHAFRGYIMCHMTADSLDEIHHMAQRIGMERRWFQTPPKASHPHYDIPEDRRARALDLGAVEVCPRTGLYFAARLGLEWAQSANRLDLREKYLRTLQRTERYAAQLPGYISPY